MSIKTATHEIFDLNHEVIHVPAEIAKIFKFAIAYESKNHGTMYNLYTMGAVRLVAQERNKSIWEEEQRAADKGHKMYWLNNCCTMLTDTKNDELVPAILLKDGQKVMLDGVILEVKHDHGEYYNLVEVLNG